MSPRPVERPARAWRSEGVRGAAEVGTPPAPRGPRAHQRLPAFTCRCPRGPLGSSTCAPAPRAAAADPGSCPAAPSPLLPGSETAAPSGTLPTPCRRRSPLPALRAAPPRPPSLSPAGGAGEPGRLHHLRVAVPRGCGTRLGAGVQTANSAGKQVNAAPAVPGRRESRGVQVVSPGMVTPRGRTCRTRLWAAPFLSPPPGLGAEGRVRTAGGCSHFTPGSHDQEEEESALTREKGGGSRGVNTLPSCCQSVSKDQSQASFLLAEEGREEWKGYQRLSPTAFHA